MKKIFVTLTILLLLAGAGCMTTDPDVRPSVMGTLHTDQNETFQAHINAFVEARINKYNVAGTNLKTYCAGSLAGYDDKYAYAQMMCGTFSVKNEEEPKKEDGNNIMWGRFTYEQPDFQIVDVTFSSQSASQHPTVQDLFPEQVDRPLPDTMVNKLIDEVMDKAHGSKVVQGVVKEITFSEQINKSLPKYTFHLVNISSSTPAHIDIYRGSQTNKPFQVITLDPAVFVRMSDNLPIGTADVNFDGFLDVGVLVDGGAKWSAFQYWTFDKKTGTFVTTTYTQELKDIGYNEIKFDKQNNRIITSNFYGAVLGGHRNVYQYKNGHLKLIENDIADNIAQDQSKQDSLTNCKITIEKYDGAESNTTTKTLPSECPPKYFGF